MWCTFVSFRSLVTCKTNIQGVQYFLKSNPHMDICLAHHK